MTARPKRSTVSVDMKKNRLVITLHGTIRKNDLENIYTDIRFGVGDLQSGFDVVTDMRDSTIGYLTGITTFLKIQKFLKESGVGRIVRITGASKTFLQQIQSVTESRSGYSPVYVETLEAAEEYLSEKNLNSTSGEVE